MAVISTYPVKSLQGTDYLLGHEASGLVKRFSGSDFSGGGGSSFSGTRADIASATPTDSVITVSGYRSAGDLGAGAQYTSVGATANGILAIQDSGGTWWNLFIPNNEVHVGWFGAYADNDGTGALFAFHPIAAPDIAANAWWRGTYTAGMSWDYVAVQEAIYAAFAYRESTPGTVIWNDGSLSTLFNSPNHRLVVTGGAGDNSATGLYSINEQIVLQAVGVEIDFGDRASSATWYWIGSESTTMFMCNPIAYGTVRNARLSSSTQADPGAAPLWVLDYDGTGQIGLKTQQLTIESPILQCHGNNNAISISPSGGSAQGDTITFINPGFFGANADTAILLGGSNCLGITILGGDIQGFVHTGIAGNGQVFVYGMSFQNQNQCDGFAPVLNQYTTFGADISLDTGSGPSGASTLKDIRSESDILAIHFQGDMNIERASVSSTSQFSGFTAGHNYQMGHVIGNAGTAGRAFMVVETGGTLEWVPVGVGSTTTVIQDPTASYTVNQWAGYTLLQRYPFGDLDSGTIASNTATSITLTAPLFAISSDMMYQIVKPAGAAAPTWSSITEGHHTPLPGNAQGFTTTAASADVVVGSGIYATISVGDYVVIPNASNVVPVGAATYKQALIAKVTAKSLGTTLTLNRTAQYSLTDTYGYWGTAIADTGGFLKVIDFNYNTIYGALSVDDTAIAINSFGSGHIEKCHQMSEVVALRRDFLVPSAVSSGQGNDIFNLVTGVQWDQMALPVTPSGTIDLTDTMYNGNSALFTPTSDTTLNAPIPFAGQDTGGTNLGQDFYLVVKTSGTTSYNLTFGTNFVSGGVLATGTVSGAYLIVHFRANGSSWVEVSRYPAAAGASGITVGTTAIASGTNKHVAYDDSGVFGEAANFTIESGNPNVSSTNAYLCDTRSAILTVASGTNSNWFIGGAGNISLSGVQNVGLGELAGAGLSSGNTNTCLGRGAGQMLSTGNNNVILGGNAAQSLTSGSRNFALGSGTLGGVTTENDNIAINAMATAAGASQCVAIGSGACGAATNGNHTAVGYLAVANNTSGAENTGVGMQALTAVTSGNSNVGIGKAGGNGITTGDSNTCIGVGAGGGITTGSNNTVIGRVTGLSSSLANNVILGDGAGNIVFQYDPTNGIYIKNSAAFLLRAKTTLTDGAAASAATLTNAPAAGNPTKWFAIDDNGTTRYIPAW